LQIIKEDTGLCAKAKKKEIMISTLERTMNIKMTTALMRINITAWPTSSVSSQSMQ
jgi:hypothetical protein